MSLKNYKTLVDNRRSRFEYELLDTYEAGLELMGTEVKSIRSGRVNLQDAFALVRDGEAWLLNMHIAPHETASRSFNHDPTRRRKLLLHKKEINKIAAALQQKGLTLVPLRLVLSNGWIKIHMAVARGKKLYDKRQSLKEKQVKRETQRALKERV
ncbi:SsrA-binding protein SmpB [Synechococcus sp. PCC 7336]|uniref:SsrA-binding protein SmpB n=1 Tax=Synechococcus sp. PCC 7336 TaxID=195250 RepID=UPI000347B581|nr:SsrA-binding protein SmpB [Synechococcus sp. PCC 7336]